MARMKRCAAWGVVIVTIVYTLWMLMHWKRVNAPIEPRVTAKTAGKRIVVVGDIHGDPATALKVLKLAGIACDADEGGGVSWCADKDTVLVQTGDLVDRGSDSLGAVRLMMTIAGAAPSRENVRVLVGNHEIMALSGDLRYASPKDVKNAGGKEARASALSANGVEGAWLRKYTEAIAIVGDTLFVHGGLASDAARFGADEINRRIKAALSRASIEKDWGDLAADKTDSLLLLSHNGPLWNRAIAKGDCKELLRSLDLIGVRRMVVGHTVQPEGIPTAKCSGRLFLVDVGMSSVYGGGHVAALELSPDGIASVITKTGKKSLL